MPDLTTDIPGEAIVVGISLVMILIFLGINIFFIKRLVTKLDQVSDQLPLLKQKVSEMETTIKDLSKDLKDVGRLKEKIAVLEYALNELKHPPK